MNTLMNHIKSQDECQSWNEAQIASTVGVLIQHYSRNEQPIADLTLEALGENQHVLDNIAQTCGSLLQGKRIDAGSLGCDLAKGCNAYIAKALIYYFDGNRDVFVGRAAA